ncbi:MAG: histidine phosphatase family protein [Planctomycetota bacterium]|nr:MAG: histidine phosphatase family protein [Planctomycetota bacterium]
MNLPAITDGTVALRPFVASDGEAAVSWVAGPMSRERSATDGGPVSDEQDARRLVERLCHSNAYTVVVDDKSCGWASLYADGKRRGHVQVVLANPRLWAQGIGGRVIRLLQRVAFDHLEYEGLQVSEVPETADSARVSLEDAGFALVERRLKERDGTEQVVVDYALDEVSYHSSEQRVFLIHHGRSQPEAEGLLVGATMDPPLDHIGRAQAEALSLSGLLYGTSECICSPAKRARATAEQAFAAHDIPIAIAEEWGDRHWGEHAGLAASEVPRAQDGLLLDPRTGEGEADVMKRLQGALRNLPYGGHLAVVTHGCMIAAVLRHLQPRLGTAGGLASGIGIAHGSITELRRGPSGWRIIRIGDERHQQGRRATAESA